MTLGEAVSKNGMQMGRVFPTALSNAEYEALKLAERQHATGVAVRMNPQTFRVEYYDVKTGQIVK